jgi:hypothetical protein
MYCTSVTATRRCRRQENAFWNATGIGDGAGHRRWTIQRQSSSAANWAACSASSHEPPKRCTSMSNSPIGSADRRRQGVGAPQPRTWDAHGLGKAIPPPAITGGWSRHEYSYVVDKEERGSRRSRPRHYGWRNRPAALGRFLVRRPDHNRIVRRGLLHFQCVLD